MGVIRLLVFPAAIIVLGLVIVGFVYETPSSYFKNRFFWSGFIFYFADAWFLLMNPRSKLASRLGIFIFVGSGLLSVNLSYTYPDALPFVWGFMGLLAAIAIRGSVGIARRARWRYCPQCGESTWFVRKNGEWVCRKPEHQDGSLVALRSDSHQGILDWILILGKVSYHLRHLFKVLDFNSDSKVNARNMID